MRINYKYISILLIILTVFLAVSCVSAADNDTRHLNADEDDVPQVNDTVVAEEEPVKNASFGKVSNTNYLKD